MILLYAADVFGGLWGCDLPVAVSPVVFYLAFGGVMLTVDRIVWRSSFV
jgi:hypothetical protein